MLLNVLQNLIPNDAHAEHATVQVNIGMEGTYFLRYKGPRLEAKPVDEKAAIVLRVADVVRDDTSDLYELRFIGQYPGQYDLKDYLQRIDGESLDDLQRLSVSIGSLLPHDHSGDLETIAHPPLPNPWPYRLTLFVLAGVWSLPAVILIGRRVFQRRKQYSSIAAGEETLADRLKPLVLRALSGELSRREQATLERSLISHWREQLELHDCTTLEALKRMHNDPVAGELLKHLERWLHQPPASTEVDLNEILHPYCEVPLNA